MTPFSVQFENLDGGTENDIKQRERMDLTATPGADSHVFASCDENLKTVITPMLH